VLSPHRIRFHPFPLTLLKEALAIRPLDPRSPSTAGRSLAALLGPRRRAQQAFARWLSYTRARMPDSLEPQGPDSTPVDGGSGARDLDLARHALAGVGDARRELARRLVCVPRMLGALNARWGRPLGAHDLEDLVQDVLVSLWRALPSYSGLSALESWVFRCCHRALAARLRRGRIGSGVQGSEVLERVPHESPALNDDIYHALESLEPRARQVIELKHFAERTFEEIGSDLARSPNTVKTWYYQALEDLRRVLARSRAGGRA